MEKVYSIHNLRIDLYAEKFSEQTEFSFAIKKRMQENRKLWAKPTKIQNVLKSFETIAASLLESPLNSI